MKDKVRDTYDKIAGCWKSKVWVQSSDFNARIVKFADTSGNEKSLDVGIGSGDLETSLSLADVTGIDLSSKMIEECRRLHPHFKLYVCDAEALPFDNESFDFVYCRNLLQHFEDPSKAFAEMYRVTKRGGKILAIESAVYKNETFCVTPIVRVTEPHHPEFPSHEMLRVLFERCNVGHIEQRVEGLHKKWLNGWCKSKAASEEQRKQVIDICRSLPKGYRKKYNLAVYDPPSEIESTLTFSFIKGYK
ncbi:MAG: class I SAM-dependent methyltransferase [Nanoarchaeota archaeon]|nr:class I SAM-dependent methyltransferase [Nanoarchaeota archaeon]